MPIPYEPVHSTSRSAARGRRADPVVQRRPREAALAAEAWEASRKAKRAEWAAQGMYLTYRELLAGEPCRACGRAILASAGPVDPEARLRDEDEFRALHASCIGPSPRESDEPEHCLECCPPRPLAPQDVIELREILAVGDTSQYAWHVELTCDHVTTMTTGDPIHRPRTAQCAECDQPRGVLLAARVRPAEAAGADDARSPARPYLPLTDEQWALIETAVEPDGPQRRGRPRANGRIVADAILFREHTGIIWRDLPAVFGSWQTASRRHREMVASGAWTRSPHVSRRTPRARILPATRQPQATPAKRFESDTVLSQPHRPTAALEAAPARPSGRRISRRITRLTRRRNICATRGSQHLFDARQARISRHDADLEPKQKSPVPSVSKHLDPGQDALPERESPVSSVREHQPQTLDQNSKIAFRC